MFNSTRKTNSSTHCILFYFGQEVSLKIILSVLFLCVWLTGKLLPKMLTSLWHWSQNYAQTVPNWQVNCCNFTFWYSHPGTFALRNFWQYLHNGQHCGNSQQSKRPWKYWKTQFLVICTKTCRKIVNENLVLMIQSRIVNNNVIAIDDKEAFWIATTL